MYFIIPIFLLSSLLTNKYACTDSEMSYIPDDWVNHNDMRYYDHSSKTMRKEIQLEKYMPSEESSEHGIICNQQCPLSKIKDCETNIRLYEIFIERFVNRMLHVTGLNDVYLKNGAKASALLRMKINGEALSSLRMISDDVKPTKLDEIDKIFSEMFELVSTDQYFSSNSYFSSIFDHFSEFSLEKFTIVCFVLLSGYLLWLHVTGFSYYRILGLLFAVFLLAGLAWNWWNMYQEASVNAYIQLSKYPDFPDGCKQKTFSAFSRAFTYLFSGNEEHYDCDKYYRAKNIDAFSKVSPTVVLSETISSMFLHPMGKAGKALGDFTSGILEDAPYLVRIVLIPIVFVIALVALVLIFILTLAMMSGMDLHLSSFFGGIWIRNASAIFGKRTQQNIQYESERNNQLGIDTPRVIENNVARCQLCSHSNAHTKCDSRAITSDEGLHNGGPPDRDQKSIQRGNINKNRGQVAAGASSSDTRRNRNIFASGDGEFVTKNNTKNQAIPISQLSKIYKPKSHVKRRWRFSKD